METVATQAIKLPKGFRIDSAYRYFSIENAVFACLNLYIFFNNCSSIDFVLYRVVKLHEKCNNGLIRYQVFMLGPGTRCVCDDDDVAANHVYLGHDPFVNCASRVLSHALVPAALYPCCVLDRVPSPDHVHPVPLDRVHSRALLGAPRPGHASCCVPRLRLHVVHDDHVLVPFPSPCRVPVPDPSLVRVQPACPQMCRVSHVHFAVPVATTEAATPWVPPS